MSSAKVLAIVALCCCAAAAAAARSAPTATAAAAGADSVGTGASGVLALRGGKPAYKNTQPIIGILTQPCSDCPGK